MACLEVDGVVDSKNLQEALTSGEELETVRAKGGEDIEYVSADARSPALL